MDREALVCTSQAHDAGEFTWAPTVLGLMVPHASHHPTFPKQVKRAGSSEKACRGTSIRNHTAFHLVTSRWAGPAIGGSSKRSLQIIRAPSSVLGVRADQFRSAEVTIWLARSRYIQHHLHHAIYAGTPTQGMSTNSPTTHPHPHTISSQTEYPATWPHYSTSSSRPLRY